jgi:NADH:ubiquinone oxidoreductase subunit 4 (subunit M)
MASFLTLVLVWRVATRRVAWIYSVAVAISAVSLFAGQIVLQWGDPGWARALLLSGLVLKLAIVPLLLWLPMVAEAVPALVIGVIIAVVDMAAFGELFLTAQAHPGFFEPRAVWIAAALASSLLASLLMLTQRNLKRLLALSSIEDIGFLLLGVTSASELGLRGALFGATVHALAKALLFISLSAPEADGVLTGTRSARPAFWPACWPCWACRRCLVSLGAGGSTRRQQQPATGCSPASFSRRCSRSWLMSCA